MLPELGTKLVIVGGTVTVYKMPFDVPPVVVTVTLPVKAPAGTLATMTVSDQLVIVVAVVPLNLTVDVPWIAPKLVPVMVTEVPTGPERGLIEVIAGAGVATDPS